MSRRYRGACDGRGVALAAATALAVLGILAAAWRLLQWGDVFVADRVLMPVGDPWYHLRLALYARAHFPDYLTFDPFVGYPDGAAVPWPPLYDLLLAASAPLFGEGERAVARATALWPPVLAALTLVPVAVAARAALGTTAAALGAAALFALSPASLVVSRVGYGDHHAFVAFAGAVLLACQAATVQRDAPGWALGAGAWAARCALLLSWPGSLLYLGVAEPACGLVAVLARRRRALVVHAASLLATAAAVAPFAARALTPVGGPFSAMELSWLPVTACTLAAAWAAACARFAVPRPDARVRGGLALGLGAAAALLLAALPPVRSGLARAGSFMARGDVWAQNNPEQMPLFASLGEASFAEVLFGPARFVLVLAPLALAWHGRRRPAAALAAAWCAVLLAAALAQARFASDLAVSLSLGFTALFAAAGAAGAALVPGLRERSWPARALAVALAAALLGPAAWREQGPHLRAALAAPGEGPSGQAALLESPIGSLVVFAEMVRAATPETAGFHDPQLQPEYGVLADPSLGHVIHAVGRRATPSDNFGPYVGSEKLLATLEVLLGRGEGRALPILERLRVRYVVSSWQPAYPPGSLLYQLHERDGREAPGLPALSRFRLVAEGPPGGVPLAALFGRGSAGVVPYKLFELVPGAEIEVPAPPDTQVAADLRLRASDDRLIALRLRAMADAGGVARVRVPYATRGVDPAAAVRPEGPWRLVTAAGVRCAHVDETDVRTSALVAAAPCS